MAVLLSKTAAVCRQVIHILGEGKGEASFTVTPRSLENRIKRISELSEEQQLALATNMLAITLFPTKLSENMLKIRMLFMENIGMMRSHAKVSQMQSVVDSLP